MKLTLIILTVALALLVPIAARADNAAQTRARYATVDKAVPKLKPITRELDGYSGERGELTAYFQNGAPVKLVARHFFNTFRLTDELYFWQGRLLFVSTTKESYNDTISAPNLKIVSRTQNRYYFKNGQLWRWVDDNGKIIGSGAEFEAQEKDQLTFAREMLAGARGKSKIIEAPKGSGMN